MIAFVRGQVAAVTLNSAVLEVGGVGLELMCTPGTLATLRTGQTATLPTSMVVREDSLTLFGFLDEEYRLSKLVERLDRGVRPGARSPYDDVWKISTFGDDRQMFMWSRIETDPFLREHARLWRGMLARAPALGDPAITMTLARSRAAVDAIRARGGDVVFVRPPSAPGLRIIEERRLARTRGWEPLLAAANVNGIHADDDPAMRGLVLPEDSHLSRACAIVFTDAYVRRIAALSDRVVLRAGAPAALSAEDCAIAALGPDTGS